MYDGCWQQIPWPSFRQGRYLFQNVLGLDLSKIGSTLLIHSSYEFELFFHDDKDDKLCCLQLAFQKMPEIQPSHHRHHHHRGLHVHMSCCKTMALCVAWRKSIVFYCRYGRCRPCRRWCKKLPWFSAYLMACARDKAQFKVRYGLFNLKASMCRVKDAWHEKTSVPCNYLLGPRRPRERDQDTNRCTFNTWRGL